MSSEEREQKPEVSRQVENLDDYVPDQRLNKIYSEAHDLDTHGLEGLCPAYSELAAVEVRYRDESLVGEGALKEVYRIYDEHLQRWVAMARLRKGRGPDYYDLFVREARLIATLSHPNIIKVHSIGVWDDGRPFFTMDLKSKLTLADAIKVAERSELHQLLQIFGKVCDAVAYAHFRGVLHLDLKPDNIQVDDFGEVLVCDWGLGKIVEEVEFELEGAEPPAHIWGEMTLMGQIKGSLGYMAPEQVEAEAVKDRRTDIYALGCILHCILTGQAPFTGERDEVLRQTARSEVASLRIKYPGRNIPEGLDAVVIKATAKDPEARYQSVGQLKEDLESYLAGFATRAEQPGFVREAQLFVARNYVPVGILVVALLVMGVTSVLFVQHLQEQRLGAEIERERAEQLSSAVEALDTKYTTYRGQTLEAKRELANQLALSARELRNLAIFERPIFTIRRTRQMVNTALQQDASSVAAHAQHYATDCVQLNYKAALARPREVHSVSPYDKYILFAEAFSDFDFSEHNRPSVDQLANFIRQARLIDHRLLGYFERVLAYDIATRKSRAGYEEVVEAYLQYRNRGGSQHFTLSLDAESLALKLWSDKAVRLKGQYDNCLLRFLTFASLELDVVGRIDLRDLNGLPIEYLDFSRSQAVVLDRLLSLPQLKVIVMRPEQFSEDQLRRLIKSKQFFKIISPE